MEKYNDVVLNNPMFSELSDKLSFLSNKPNFLVFVLSTTVGILLDETGEDTDKYEEAINVPRTVLINNTHIIEKLFRSIMLSTEHEDASKEDRIIKGFNPDVELEISRLNTLKKYACGGIAMLHERIMNCSDNSEKIIIDEINSIMANAANRDINIEFD